MARRLFTWPAYNGHLDVVQYLLTRMAQIWKPQTLEADAASLACWEGHLDVVQYLLTSRGANLEATDNSGETPLHFACEEGRLAIVLYLLTRPHPANLEATDNDGRTALHHACWCGHPAVVQYILTDHDANLEATDNDGKTPLHCACRSPMRTDRIEHHCDVARLLVEAGADLNTRDNDGDTCLHLACAASALEIVRFLLDAGAELFSLNNNGGTAFDLAVNAKVVEYLLQFYAGKVTQCEGRQALHAILRVANYSYVPSQNFHPPLALEQLLVELPLGKLTMEHFWALFQLSPGVSIRSLDHRGNTPLHVACRFKAPVVILGLLVQANAAALCTADRTGALPLHVACRSNASIDDIRFLVGAGGSSTVHSLDNTGSFPLHALCEAADPSVEAVTYLVDKFGGALEAKTVQGKLPLMVACESSASENVIMVLLTTYPEALDG